MPTLSARARSLQPSPTLAIAAKAKALQREGHDVLSFAAGEPDFPTPEPIRQAAIDALNAGKTKYAPTLGDPEAREAIAAKLTSFNKIPGLTANNVMIGVGAKHALYLVAQMLFDAPPQGEPWEAILPVPAWVSYEPILTLAGAKIRPVEMTPASGFKMTPDQLRAAITPRSKALFLNTPSNPCGCSYSGDEIRALAKVIADAARSTAPELVVVTDEIYERIIFGNQRHVSPGSIPEIADRTITINGLSKSYAMTGWRIGYAACPGEWGADLITAIGRLQDQMTSNITSFIYPAIPVALKECEETVESMRQAFEKRAQLISGRLTDIPGVKLVKPQAAFYAFPDISAHFGRTTPSGTKIDSDVDVARAMLEEHLVAIVPGSAFGGCGHNHIRFSFACSEAQIEKGMDRLAAFVRSLS